jgi:hypothetical protein
MSENNTTSYPYLIKRAVKIAIEFVIIAILLFFLPVLIQFFLYLYGV